MTEDFSGSKLRSPSAVLLAEKLAREISATYDDTRYTGLPRPALIDIQKWLMLSTTAQNYSGARTRKAVAALLRSHAYDVEMQEEELIRFSPNVNSLFPNVQTTIELLGYLVPISIDTRRRGNTQIADDLLEGAKTLEKGQKGTEDYVLRLLKAEGELLTSHVPGAEQALKELEDRMEMTKFNEDMGFTKRKDESSNAR